MDLRKQTEIMVKYMLSAEKESVEDKEIVESYVDAMMLMYKEHEVFKNESLHLVSNCSQECEWKADTFDNIGIALTEYCEECGAKRDCC